MKTRQQYCCCTDVCYPHVSAREMHTDRLGSTQSQIILCIRPCLVYPPRWREAFLKLLRGTFLALDVFVWSLCSLPTTPCRHTHQLCLLNLLFDPERWRVPVSQFNLALRKRSNFSPNDGRFQIWIFPGVPKTAAVAVFSRVQN